MSSYSKPLSKDDSSAFELEKDALAGGVTYSIKFDRIQLYSNKDCLLIIEPLNLLLPPVSGKKNPHNSHPNNYFKEKKLKFLSLWKFAQHANALLFLVNYVPLGEKGDKEIRMMEVLGIDEKDASNPIKTKNYDVTRDEFSDWLRKTNKFGMIKS